MYWPRRNDNRVSHSLGHPLISLYIPGVRSISLKIIPNIGQSISCYQRGIHVEQQITASSKIKPAFSHNPVCLNRSTLADVFKGPRR